MCAPPHIPTYHCSTHVICSALHTHRSMSGLSYDCHNSSCGSIDNFYATLTKAPLKSRCRAPRCRFDHSPVARLLSPFTPWPAAQTPLLSPPSTARCSTMSSESPTSSGLRAELKLLEQGGIKPAVSFRQPIHTRSSQYSRPPLGASHRLGTVIRICVHALPVSACVDDAIVYDHTSYSYTT